MKKILMPFMLALALFMTTTNVFAASNTTYKVASGDSMWKIAVKYQVGVSEIIGANPQVKNPNLIYPGQTLNIPSLPASTKSFEERVIELTNQKRVGAGLKPLTANWELSRVARYKSQDMVDKKYFSHTSPTYGSPFDMMKKFGISYRAAGENIAYGQRTPEAVVDAWWNSPGHKANMMNPNFTQIGVGYVANGNYWTQMFIG